MRITLWSPVLKPFPFLSSLAVLCSAVSPFAEAATTSNTQQAQRPQNSVETRTFHPGMQKGAGLQLSVPKVEREITLADFDGLKPNAWVKEHLAEATDFVQNQPNDGRAPTEPTVAWMGRTESTFFIAFVCFDHHMAQLRGHLTRRENIDAEDSVGLLLDPFQDRRRGILFQVNPLGVQADASWTEPGDADYSYDQVWNSSAKRTDKGWVAVLSIPYRSLRARANASQWGIVLSRNLPRNSETDYWPRVSQSITGTLSQEGSLLGMEGTGSHNIQINPYAFAHRTRELNDDDPNNPFISNRNLAGTAGGDIKAVVKDSIVLDGTINPDFSQVESDQPQFRINQRYAVYYPELRPFFLENASYFDAPITLLYTRTIGNPEFGARATGKIRHTNIGFLTIDDRAPGTFVANNDPLRGKRAYTTVARVSQDIGRLSNIGVLYAQRTLAGSSNRAGGADFNWRIGHHWDLQGALMVSSTHNLDGTYQAGSAKKLRLERNGRSLYLNFQYRDFSQDWRADAGFTSVPQVKQFNSQTNYQWYPITPTAKRIGLQSIGVEVSNRFAWDRTGQRVFHYNTTDVYASFKRNTVIAPLIGQNSDTVRPVDFAQVTQPINFTENFVGFVARSQPLPQFAFNITAKHGATVNYNPVGNAIPGLLTDDTVNASVTLQPISPLTIDNIYLLDRASDAHTGASAYESQTFRTKMNYQFTRAVSLRAIVEYDSVLRNPQLSSLDRTKQVATQVLFTWLPHPGTAIYAGYNSDLQNLDRNLCTRLQTGTCDQNMPILARANNYLNDGKEFFVKASYLLRF